MSLVSNTQNKAEVVLPPRFFLLFWVIIHNEVVLESMSRQIPPHLYHDEDASVKDRGSFPMDENEGRYAPNTQ